MFLLLGIVAVANGTGGAHFSAKAFYDSKKIKGYSTPPRFPDFRLRGNLLCMGKLRGGIWMVIGLVYLLILTFVLKKKPANLEV